MLDELDAGQRIGAAADAAVHRPASTVEDDIIGEGVTCHSELGRVDGGVVAAAADERIVAAAAGELVGYAIADEGVAGATADDVLDVDEGSIIAGVLYAGCGVGAEIDAHRAGGAGVVERVAATTAIDHVGAVADDILEGVVAATAGEVVDAGAAVEDDAAGGLRAGDIGIGSARALDRQHRLADVLHVAILRVVDGVSNGDPCDGDRGTGDVLVGFAGADTRAGAVDGAVGDDEVAAGPGRRGAVVARRVVAGLDRDRRRVVVRRPGAVRYAGVGEREVGDSDVVIDAVLQVDFDADAGNQGRTTGGRARAVEADVVHAHAGDQRVRQGLDVDALGGHVLEMGAADGDVGGKAVAGLADRGVLGEVDADIAVGERAAGDGQAVDVGVGALLDADEGVADVDIGQRGVADVAGEAHTICEAVDIDVRQRDIVGRDGDAVAGRAVIGRRGRDPIRQIPGDAVVAFERAVNGDLAEADQGHAYVDHHVLAVGAGGDHDGVAGGRGRDRGLDGGVAAVADQQDVGRASAVDLLDAGERVGALAAARRHEEVAGAVAGHRRGGDAGIIGRGVSAAAPDQGVVAAASVEDVVAGVAGDRVGIAVAAAVDVAVAGQGQVLDVGPKPVADRRLHGVSAFVEGLRHHIAGILHDIGVAAGAAGEHVDAAVAGDDVVEAVAGAVDVSGAGQGQVLDICAERVSDRRLHRVGAGADAGGFRHHIAGVVDDVGVVAGAADHSVGAAGAVERVGASVAGDGVGEAVAGAIDVGDYRSGSGSRHWRRA